jgi:hypothetical protein
MIYLRGHVVVPAPVGSGDRVAEVAEVAGDE